MTTVNYVQSPISSFKPSLSLASPTINPKVSTFFFSSFCFESGLVLNDSSIYSPMSNSPTPILSSTYLLGKLSPKRSFGPTSHFFDTARHQHYSRESNSSFPLNVSLLATVYNSGYKNESNSIHLNEGPENGVNSDFLSSKRINEDMLESFHNRQNSLGNVSSEDDERTLKLAVELTMLNLKKLQPLSPSAETKLHQKHFPNIHSSLDESYSLSNPYRMTTKVFLQAQSRTTIVTAPTTSALNHHLSTTIDLRNISKTNSLTDLNQTFLSNAVSDERSKKSQNMTECVPVPSSEHVAEIVGRQGCKIKALRAKTNTYIKTPVRNEEPVFVVTGRKEDVSKAKHEILSAAEHFTVIRATRRLNDNMGIHSPASGGKQQILGLNKSNAVLCTQTTGQVTIQVRVPYRLVGLVVGTKGNTIKHIQHETQTYIVTPSRDKEPIFEVTGLADNVEMARRHIEVHIATRIGGTQNNSVTTSISPPSHSPCTTMRQSADVDSAESSLHSLNALNHMLSDDVHSEILSSIYKNGICSTLDCGQIPANEVNTKKKCSNLHSINGFFGDINATMLPVEDFERSASYSLNGHVNNQMKCVDFVNNLIDSNNTQFSNEQRTQFT